MKRTVVRAGLAVTLLGATWIASAETPRTIEITARRFEFAPAEVHLKLGETAVLRLTSVDTTHGVLSKELGFDEELPPGTPVEVQVTPRKAGLYRVICDYFCGKGHAGMKLAIVVDP